MTFITGANKGLGYETARRLDVLINYACVAGPYADAADLTAEDFHAVFDVNVLGVVRTTIAFLPLLRRSSDPVIVNVGSGMGSLELTHDLNANSGPQTVTEGTDAVVALATEGPGHGSGRFVDRHGETSWG
ncbi:hypothetical protein B1790_25365 [Mycobacterium sp. AT1]|nr:hypothetical protein B1790_25365 [Mycobacterium sp. AT1]